MRSRPLWLLVAGWALLLLAWTIGNPPFAAPDEADHYVRAVGFSAGHALGRPAPDAVAGETSRQRAWTRQATRSFAMPPRLAPPVDCYLHDARRPAACLDAAAVPEDGVRVVTAVGTYQPLPYLLPAATVRIGDDARSAVRWGRAAGALAVLVLLIAAALAVADGSGGVRPLLGLAAAVTPMVLFCGASLTGSGLEIGAAIALTCGMLRLARGPAVSPWVWVLTAIAGAALALSRSDGPLWMVVILLAGMALAGRRGAVACVRTAPVAAAATGTALVVAIGLNRWWELAYGPHVRVPTRAIPLGIRVGIEQWGRASRELVGGFGYLEFVLPLWIPLAWLAVVLVLLTLAGRGADRRQRRVLVGVAAAATVLPVVLYVLVIRATGFGLQGRHVLPIAVVVPLLAGEVIDRRGVSVRRSWLVAIGATVAVVQLVAFWCNARRSAVGIDGPLFFVADAQWTPPLGWWAVLALAVLGCTTLLAAFATAREPAPARRPPRPPSTTRSRWRRAGRPTRTRAPR